jgi:hypothetical protein
MRALGFRERVIEVERDSWILIAAQVPEQVPVLMAVKRQQIENQGLRELYRDIGEVVDCAPDDPGLPELADRVVAFVEAAAAAASGAEPDDPPLRDDLVELLDSAFLDSFPSARRLLELLEERGLRGWTMIERVTSRDQERDQYGISTPDTTGLWSDGIVPANFPFDRCRSSRQDCTPTPADTKT